MISIKDYLTIILLFSCVITLPSYSFSIIGTEKPERIVTIQTDRKCFIFNHYVVITTEKKDSAGMTMLIQTKPKIKKLTTICHHVQNRTILTLNEEASYFIGLAGYYLFTDNGTSPERELAIYRLDEKRKFYQILYDDTRNATLKNHRLTFYIFDDKNAAISHCPSPANDLRKGLNSEITLNLKTLQQDFTGKTICVMRQ